MAGVFSRNGVLYVRSRINGVLYPYSTGKADNALNRKYVEKNKDVLFERLHNKSSKRDINPFQLVPTFEEYGRYVLELKKRKRSEKTSQAYFHMFTKLCEFFGSSQIDCIRSSKIFEWQNLMISQGYKGKTVNNYRGVLANILIMAEHDGLIAKNPLLGVESESTNDSRIANPYTFEEIQQLVKVASDFSKSAINYQTLSSWLQFQNILLFNFWTGLRSGELIALKWSHIQEDEGKIIVCENIQDGIIKEPKDGERIIELTSTMLNILNIQKHITGLHKYVFVNYKGEPYANSKALDVMFKKACKACNLRLDFMIYEQVLLLIVCL